MPTIKNRKFRDIKDHSAIPKWLKSLDDELDVLEVELPFGTPIGDHRGIRRELRPRGETLGIIMEGEAELFEVSPFDDVLAYRPIRVLAAKAIFGDFSILDKYHYPDKDQQGSSRRGETWKIVAGRQCLTTTQRLSAQYRKDHAAYLIDILGPIERTDEFFEYANKKYIHLAEIAKNRGLVTRLAMLPVDGSSSVFKDNPTLVLGLHEHGWKRAKTYRDCLNSFNWHELLWFRASASALAGKGLGQIGRVLHPFADAVIDALNRPIRQEPCFKKGLPTWMNRPKVVKAFNDVQVAPEAVLHASLDFCERFYFPIDFHNYFVNLGLHFQVKELDSAALKSLGSEFRKLFPISNESDLAKRRTSGYHGDATQYPELASLLIKEFRKTLGSKYPYDVTAIWCDGATRDMLLLEFTPNT